MASLFDLSFTRFITVRVLRVLYVISLVLIAVTVLLAIISGFTQGFGFGLLSLILAPLFGLLYVILTRVSLELIAVIFRIGKDIGTLAGRNPEDGPSLQAPSVPAPPPSAPPVMPTAYGQQPPQA